MTRLCQLLQQPREPGRPVARCWDEAGRRDRAVSWEELRHDVAGLRARLDDAPKGAWLLLTEDAYLFTVGLLALWHSGRHATLPPNRQPRALEILCTRAAGVLCDRSSPGKTGTSLHPLRDAVRGDPSSLKSLRPDALAVELYTSGTTGMR